MAAAAWRAGAPADRRSNRLFLALFAVYLVKHFRTEEHRLDRTKAPDRARHRMEHRRLVRQLRDVMMDLDLGVEVTQAIHGFLEAWRLHQESASLRRVPPGSLGH
jgi:hemerythrin